MSLFTQTLVKQMVNFGQTTIRVAAQPGPQPVLMPPARGGGRQTQGCTPCAAAQMVRDARRKFGR